MREEVKTGKLPLEGIRVTDLTGSWAGPYMTNLMASLGAEVIKVDSIQRLDLWRVAGVHLINPDEKRWEWSPNWNAVNTDKLCITLNLNEPRGVEVLKRLAKISDVVAENYTPRVMQNWGLDYSALKEINPRLIMIRLPAHGNSGPWKDLPGFANPLEMTSGFAQLMGYPDGPPMITGTGPTDPLAGINGMAAVMFALLYRQMTGEGQLIDLSQVEAATSLIGDAIAETSMNGTIPARRGNRHPSMAPHGYYRCKGDEMWVGIAVSSDEEWQNLCTVIGNPPWTREDRFADGLSRRHNQDDLDKLLEEWTSQHDHYEVMNTLQKAGVAAGAYLTGAELLTDPHLRERGTFQMVDRAIVGTHPYPIPTAPIKFSQTPVKIRRPAPLLGEHNDYVLGELLGMSAEEIQGLADDKIIGTEPLGV